MSRIQAGPAPGYAARVPGWWGGWFSGLFWAMQIREPLYYMQLAYSQALRAFDLGEIPVGAVVVDLQGRVVAEACNMTISRHDPSAHAEMLALRLAGEQTGEYRLPGYNMYVTLEPCCMCAGAIIHSRLHHLYYGAADPRTGACGTKFSVLNDPRHNHKVIIAGGIMAAECSELLKAFFRQRRKMQKEGRDWMAERGLVRSWSFTKVSQLGSLAPEDKSRQGPH